MKLAITVIAAALTLAAPASAGRNGPMPDPSTHRIAIPVAIGGVSLGDSLDEANETWGGRGRCGTKVLPDSCYWGDFYDDFEGRAEVASTDGVVDFVRIAWNGVTEGGKPDVRRAIARFRTNKGIHLGSKLTDVPKAHPAAEPIKHGSNDRIQAWVISRAGTSSLVFGGGKFVNYINLTPSD
jgi:hypothetical protein